MQLGLTKYYDKFSKEYHSPSQIIRRVTENWFKDNMYCPACAGKALHEYETNEPVRDFYCENCRQDFQLKGKRDSLGKRILDGQYDTLMSSVKENSLPNFAFLVYHKTSLQIRDLLLIPHYFITSSIIEKRKPLSSTAVRRGYVGCNILYRMLPERAKIYVVKDNAPIAKNAVVKNWADISFVADFKNPDARGWLSDILFCLDAIKKVELSLADFYAFEKYFQELHPENKHIRDKIRQQLQILRAKGIIEFLGKGVYRKKV